MRRPSAMAIHYRCGSIRGLSLTIILALLLPACGGPTSPSNERLIVRLTVSPPTIQAIRLGEGWVADWTVNLDAATEFPPDSHGVLLPVTSPPVIVDGIESSVTSAEGQLLAQVVQEDVDIRVANDGSNQLTAEGPLLQMAQHTSYASLAPPPSTSSLMIVVHLRDRRGTSQQLITASTIHEQLCGYRGGPPC